MSDPEASRKIARHALRYGRTALELAAHAALPVALDAVFVNLLRVNFFNEAPRALPCSAESDLLLSGLCEDVGDDLFEMRPNVRAALLSVLDRTYSQSRAREVALLLWRHGERHATWSRHTLLRRAQEVTALSYLSPERARAWLDMATFDTVAFPEADEGWFLVMNQQVARATDARAAQVIPVAMSSPVKTERVSSVFVARDLTRRWVLLTDDRQRAPTEAELAGLRALGERLAHALWSLVLGASCASIDAVTEGYLRAMVHGGVLRSGGMREQGGPGCPTPVAALALGTIELSPEGLQRALDVLDDAVCSSG